MSGSNDENQINGRRRPKRPARQVLESSSDSDCDTPLARPVRLCKTPRVDSDSSSSSSSSRIVKVPRRINHRVDSDSSSSSSSRIAKVPRRAVRRVMSNSTDGSDSDDSVAILNTRRRKVRRVLNGESSSEPSSSAEDDRNSRTGVSGSSDSEESGEFSGTDWHSDVSEQDEDLQQALAASLATSNSVSSVSRHQQQVKESQVISPKAGAASSAGYMSDSSDGESEKCPICLLSFRSQEIGTPDACDHSFCVACLEEWSKNMTTCPVDRQAFSWILVRHKLQGKVVRKIKVEDRRLGDVTVQEEDDTDPIYCEVCGRNDREDRLLLCDGCDLGYHLECLDPPLETVPIEEWFCEDCSNTSRLADAVDVYEGELTDLLEDAGDIPIRPRHSRLIPRTRQSERVRATIMSRHERATEPAVQLSTSGIDSLDNDSTPSSSNGRRRHTATASRKQRNSSKKYRKKSKHVKSTSRKRRRKNGKKSRRRTPRRQGMCTSSRPRTSVPVVRGQPMSELDTLRSRAGIPTLHLFGQRDQLDYFSGGSDDEPANFGETGVAVLPRRSLYSVRSLASRKALSALAYGSHNPANRVQRRADLVSTQHSENSATNNTPCDILGSILDSQSIWHSSKAKVTISHDGSLEVKKDSDDASKMKGESSNSGSGSLNNGEQFSVESSPNLSVPLQSLNQPLNVRDASGEARQAPMYPGRDGGNNSGGSSRPPTGGMGGYSRYGSSTSSSSGSSYQSYQSGRGYSSFSSTSSFDAHGTRASYSSYLNNPPPPPPLSFRGSPMRFRLAPRFPLRRPPGPPPPLRMPIPVLKKEELKFDDSVDVPEVSKKSQDEEEDEIDIYSDIEMGGGGSGGPNGGGSEPDETDRNMDISYEALPPPPEPSALLMGLGEQVLSDDEQASDSELVIDDNVIPSSPQDQSENAPRIPESEKYDPAEPSYDSDDDLPEPSASNKDIPRLSSTAVSSIPSLNTGMSQLLVNSSSNSNISYLHSPTYGDKPVFESESKIRTVPSEGVVTQVVQEVLKEHLKRQSVSADAEEEEDEECPNFCIYSAQSMDIARRTGEENTEENEKEAEEKVKKISDEHGDEIEHVNEIWKIPDSEEKEDPDTTVSEEGDQHPIQEEKDDGAEVLKDGKDLNDKDKDASDVDDDDAENHSNDIHSLPDVERHTKDRDESDRVLSKSVDSEHASADDTSHDEQETEIQSKLSEEDEIGREKCGDSVHGGEVENEEGRRSPSEPRDAVPTDTKPRDEEEGLKSDDNDSLIGGATSAVSAATMDNNPPVSTPPGLEGLDTETISETEETINFDDISQDGNEILTAEEDGEIPSHKKKKKKKSRKSGEGSGKGAGDLGDSEFSPREIVDYEEGEIVDDRPKTQDLSKKDKKLPEKKDKPKHDDESRRSPDENVDISQSKSVTEEDKKKKKKKTGEKGRSSRERTVLSSSENKEKGREKSRRSEENISWKKPSKSTKGRNYRDGKATKGDDSAKKDKDRDGSPKDSGKKDKKKKEKRKDMERYDVRKVVSDKKRKRRDEFGRDLSRDRSVSRSRSRSHQRSRDRSRQRSRSVSRGKRNRSRGKTPVKSSRNRSRSRSRNRTRSRSHNRSRSRSRNRSSRRSRERLRKSRSKEKVRSRISRSHSRGKRTRSRTRSRSKNRVRVRSRSRSVVRTHERKDRTVSAKESQRFHVRRSWSRTWTPSWSRSRSRSVSCSSYSQSRSPSVRHYNHSYARSFSRSWSRERHERIPVLEKKSLSKTQKKLTVIVNNTKDDSERQRKKEKKRKEGRKNKDNSGAVEKRKKRKEKSPAPSKEVFTSGDNILVSVNFNKSNKTSAAKDSSSTSLAALPKDSSKRKRDDAFEGDIDSGKKARKSKGTKEKSSPRLKAAPPAEKTALRSVGEKKLKKQTAKNSKSARMAAILKQKPVAIIDLDQSPFHEQTPSPTDLIVLSDSDETANKVGGMEELMEPMGSRRGIRTTSPNPQSSSKVAHNVATGMSNSRTPEPQSPLMSAISNYLITSTGPKTPPEPQVKFSIAPKPQLRTMNNPLLEEDDMLGDDAGLEDSDQRIEEELERGMVEIMHKGPNTPPEPRGPSTPCSPPTSPDAYDPFDPTKSGTPSPAGPEASMDGPPSPAGTPTDDLLQHVSGAVVGAAGSGQGGGSDLEDLVNKGIEPRVKSPPLLSGEEAAKELSQSPDRTKARMDSCLAKSPCGIPESVSVSSQMHSDDLSQSLDLSESLEKTKTKPSNAGNVVVSENSAISPERKMSVVITTQTPKMQGTPIKQQLFSTPGTKQIPVSQQNATSTPNHSNAPAPLFPTLTPANIASILCTPPTTRTNIFSTPAPILVPPLLQQFANSPAVPPTQKTNTRMTLDKPLASGMPLRSMVQNGEAQKQPPDTSTEVVDMDLDSPYSPGSSEGDDLFDPPVENTKANQQSYSSDRSRTSQQGNKSSSKLLGLPLVPLSTHKSPSKPPQDKFDTIFGVSPLRVNKSNRSGHQNKSHHKVTKVKATKHGKGGRKEIAIKMDEDQLQILDDLPSSAVELQVKDKFLKKLNRQERVVEEVKLSLKPHYAKKHITKEEYKQILRKSVPKICHSKSGEINPVKISTLVEAYVKKYRQSKKRNASTSSAPPPKPKPVKQSKWS